MATEIKCEIVRNREVGVVLTNVPKFSAAAGAKNWMAILVENRYERCGFTRVFLDRSGAATYQYPINDFGIGDVVEFAGDYFVDGNRVADRVYGVVTHVAKDAITFAAYETAAAALAVAKEQVKQDAAVFASGKFESLDDMRALVRHAARHHIVLHWSETDASGQQWQASADPRKMPGLPYAGRAVKVGPLGPKYQDTDFFMSPGDFDRLADDLFANRDTVTTESWEDYVARVKTGGLIR